MSDVDVISPKSRSAPHRPGRLGRSVKQREAKVAVSIAAEIETLRAALEAGRILSEQVRDGGLQEPEDEPAAHRALAAILVLVDTRLELLGRALRQAGPIEGLVSRHNRAIPGAEEVVLRGRTRVKG